MPGSQKQTKLNGQQPGMGDRKLLEENIKSVMQQMNLWTTNLISELPKKWEKHGNAVIFGPNVFSSKVWETPELKDRLFAIICDTLKAEKVARKTGSVTPNDLYRRPQIELLYGYDGWVLKLENRIKYTWDITKCMFSSGNISEKERISSWDLRNKIVVDLFAGIGYFTLSYLVHAKAEKVYACEWNPDAVDALRKNLKLNKVEERCEILVGDNRLVCPKNVTDHVNLGLIPSSKSSWEVACAALKRNVGGILHVHGNVDLKGDERAEEDQEEGETVKPEGKKKYLSPWVRWSDKVISELRAIFLKLYNEEWSIKMTEIVKVKSYGPCVDHLVVDIQCLPPTKSL